MVSSVDPELLAADHAPRRARDRRPSPRVPRQRRRLAPGLPALTLLIGVLVTLALTLLSLSQYNSNEKRLLRLRVRDAATVLTAALPTLQTNLGSAAELADATNGNVAKFRGFVAPRLAGPTPEFRSVSLWRLSALSRGPLTVVGVAPRLAASPTMRTAVQTCMSCAVIDRWNDFVKRFCSCTAPH